MNSKYDAILICNIDDIVNDINESYGDDVHTPGEGPAKTLVIDHIYGMMTLVYMPAMHLVNMLNDLNNWRKGYSAKVTDFGKWVVVEVTHHNVITGRSASKTFLVFDGGPKGTDKGGMVLYQLQINGEQYQVIVRHHHI